MVIDFFWSTPPRHWQRQRTMILYLLILDVAFLISDHFKNQRRGGSDWDSRRKEKGTVLYSELGGKRVDT